MCGSKIKAVVCSRSRLDPAVLSEWQHELSSFLQRNTHKKTETCAVMNSFQLVKNNVTAKLQSERFLICEQCHVVL